MRVSTSYRKINVLGKDINHGFMTMWIYKKKLKRSEF